MRRAGAGGKFVLVPASAGSQNQKTPLISYSRREKDSRIFFLTHEWSLHAGVVLGDVGYLPFHTFGTRNVAHRCTPLLRDSRLL